MKWLKTTAYNNLSRNLAGNLLYLQWNIKMFSARGHQWPFYHLKIQKISFPVVSESAVDYLIPDLTQILSVSVILYNLPVILRRYKILHYKRKRVALIIINKMLWYFLGTKYEFFLPPYQLTFFLVFGQATYQKRFFNSCSNILMNIPTMNYCNYFVTIFHTQRSTNLQTTIQNKR